MTWSFRHLFRQSPVDLSESQAIDALRIAVADEHVPRIETIIARFPTLLNYADEKGETPLHWAAAAEKISSVGCLVDLGADTKRQTISGRTPADFASNEIRMGALTEMCRMIHERLEAGPLK